MPQRVRRWSPAIICMAVIFWFSSQSDLPEAPSDWLDYGFKKGAHMLIYATLALCFRYALGGERGVPASRRPWLALLLVILYALSDEFHQRFTPGRHPSFTDVGYDTVGGLVGLAFWRLMQPGIENRQTPHQAGD